MATTTEPYSKDFLRIDPDSLITHGDKQLKLKLQKQLRDLYLKKSVIATTKGDVRAFFDAEKIIKATYADALEKLKQAHTDASVKLKKQFAKDSKEASAALDNLHTEQTTELENLRKAYNTLLKLLDYGYHNHKLNNTALGQINHSQENLLASHSIISQFNASVFGNIPKDKRVLRPQHSDPRAKSNSSHQPMKRKGPILDNHNHHLENLANTLKLGVYLSPGISGVKTDSNLGLFVASAFNAIFSSDKHVAVNNVKVTKNPPGAKFNIEIPEGYSDNQKIAVITKVYLSLLGAVDPDNPDEPAFTTFDLTEVEKLHGKDVAYGVATNIWAKGDPLRDYEMKGLIKADPRYTEAKVKGLMMNQKNSYCKNPHTEDAIILALLQSEKYNTFSTTANASNLAHLREQIIKNYRESYLRVYFNRTKGAKDIVPANVPSSNIVESLDIALNKYLEKAEPGQQDLHSAIETIKSFYKDARKTKEYHVNFNSQRIHNPLVTVEFIPPVTKDHDATLSAISNSNNADENDNLLTVQEGNEDDLFNDDFDDKEENDNSNDNRPNLGK